MAPSHLSFKFLKVDDQILLVLSRPGKPIENHAMPRLGGQPLPDFLPIIMVLARDALLEDLPVDSCEVTADPDLPELEPLHKAIHTLRQTVINTNQFLKTHKDLAQAAKSFSDSLFYNLDNTTVFQNLYARAKEIFPNQIHLKNMSSGFDPVTRIWGEPTVPNAEEIIDTILSLRIKTLFTLNMILLELNLATYGIYLPAIFRFLGVEHVIVDVDHYDIVLFGLLMKAYFNDESSRRYSIFSHMQACWDAELGLKNVLYMPPFSDVKKDIPPPALDPDYSAVFISNSRHEIIPEHLDRVLFVLDHLDPVNLFDDYQKWYHAMRCLVRVAPRSSIVNRLGMNVRLYNLYLALMSFLKFEVIHSLKTERRILIFGDTGWKNFFPQYYQSYLNESDAIRLFSENKYLHVLMNQNYFYLESSPVLQQALNRKHAFICQPAIVVKNGLEGLRRIEYRNAHQLNELIGNADRCFAQPEVQASLSELRRQVVDCESAYLRSLVGEVAFDDFFKKVSEDHDADIQKVLQEFIAGRMEFMGQCFQMCVSGTLPDSYNPRNSPYYDRPYLKKMLSEEA